MYFLPKLQSLPLPVFEEKSICASHSGNWKIAANKLKSDSKYSSEVFVRRLKPAILTNMKCFVPMFLDSLYTEIGFCNLGFIEMVNLRNLDLFLHLSSRVLDGQLKLIEAIKEVGHINSISQII